MEHDDLIWLAGYLEGEGSFYFKGRGRYPAISVNTTDEDVAYRVCALLRGGLYFRNGQRDRKQVYNVQAQGKRLIPLLQELAPLMGERRKTRIQAILDHWHEFAETP